MRVFAVHLLNDYSGSPKVLMQLVRGWIAHDINVTVVTTGNREGFLSGITGAHYIHYWYKWQANRFLRLICLSWSQFLLFIRLAWALKRDDIVYVNTVLPFGAALAGKIRGCRVYYHVHETSMTPRVLKTFLFSTLKKTATDVIYVSKYLMENEPAPGKRMHLLPNALENSFVEKALVNRKSPGGARNVLMVCSLKPYKGIFDFVLLARRCEHLSFRLVVNASAEEVAEFIAETSPPSNLEVFPVQTDVHPFYRWADVVLNLSHPTGWVETFGLTIIEGFAYGLPAIVPPVGGIADLVEEGSNGFHVDSTNHEALVSALLSLVRPLHYNHYARNAARRISDFEEKTLIGRSLQILNGICVGN